MLKRTLLALTLSMASFGAVAEKAEPNPLELAIVTARTCTDQGVYFTKLLGGWYLRVEGGGAADAAVFARLLGIKASALEAMLDNSPQRRPRLLALLRADGSC